MKMKMREMACELWRRRVQQSFILNSVSGSCDEKIVTVTETITELTLLLSKLQNQKSVACDDLSGFVY